VESLTEFDPLTGAKTDEFSLVKVYANSHYVNAQADAENRPFAASRRS